MYCGEAQHRLGRAYDSSHPDKFFEEKFGGARSDQMELSDSITIRSLISFL